MKQTAIKDQTEKDTPPPTTSQPVNGSKPTPIKGEIQAVSYQLDQMRPQFQAALPAHITPEKFQRTVVTAINLNPDLLKYDRRSLFNAVSKAASDGLLPDGRDGALVPFKNVVQWMPMVGGIIKKARQSGEITALGARIVYEQEIAQGKFTHRVVDGVPKVDHEPILWGERGKPVLVYSFAQFKDGPVDFEFLHADDVAKMRALSRAKSGPWFDWPEEMWKKSAIRRHAKRLPISSELFDTIARDDEMTEFARQRSEAEEKMLRLAGSQLGNADDDDGGEVIEGNSEMYSDSAEISEEWRDYLDRQESELNAAKGANDADAVLEATADRISAAFAANEITAEEAQALRDKWQEMNS